LSDLSKNPSQILWWILGVAILDLLGHPKTLCRELLTKFWVFITEGIRRLCCCPNKNLQPDEIPLNEVVPPPLPPRNEHPQLAPITEVNFDFDLKKTVLI
jgi:hypothetical protein